VVVRFADHRRACGALDRIFDLGFDGVERPFDDLQHDRVDGARGLGRGGAGSGGWAVHCTPPATWCTGRVVRMACGWTSIDWPGNTTVVEPNSSITAGPLRFIPAESASRRWTGVSRNAPPK